MSSHDSPPGRLLKAPENFVSPRHAHRVVAQAKASRRDFVRGAFEAALAGAAAPSTLAQTQAPAADGGDPNILELPPTARDWAKGLRPMATAYNAAAFEAKTMADLAKLLGGHAPTESKDVTVTGPDIAENGAVVPIAVATTLPGVKRLLVLVEKNPGVLSAIFHMSDSVEANFSTRVKMGQSSNVYALAMMGDGRLLFAQKEVKVTLGGCGG